MNVIEAIKNRRSINFFDKTKEVKKWLISDLIELAALSPSSYNLQPWEIIAVENPKRKSVLKKCAFNQPKAEEASVIFIIIANPGAVEQNPAFGCIHDVSTTRTHGFPWLSARVTSAV